jgi:hypothetical protein
MFDGAIALARDAISGTNRRTSQHLRDGRVSLWMTVACLMLAVFMATPTLASLIVFVVLAALLFATRWIAKLECQMPR